MAGELIEHDGAAGSAGELIHETAVRIEPLTSDEQLVALWLHGRPDTTAEVYRRDTARLFAHVGKPLGAVTLTDLQSYADSLSELAPASRSRMLASAKSLCAFAHRLGYLPFDVARPLRLPRLPNRLGERIIEEGEAQRIVALEPNPRNHVLLRLMYACGLRVSEACALCWRDVRSTKVGGVATLHGKGGKTRTVILQPKLWKQVAALRGEAGPDDPVLRSLAGGPIDRSQAHRIVKAACRRAGVSGAVSCHWLRHAHASHALDHGAPLHVLKESLGHASLATTSGYVHARPGDGSAKYVPE